MTPTTDTEVQVRELAAWGLDAFEYRPASAVADISAIDRLLSRPVYQCTSALLPSETAATSSELAGHLSRADLLIEMQGLEWSLGVVDLRELIAFQRRLSFHPNQPQPNLNAFPAPKQADCAVTWQNNSLRLQSNDPNVHLRFTGDAARPLEPHAGSPFFEVAEYAGRWFLRDGYHRAYHLLHAGIEQSPAVIVHARTLDELGANRPWFFSEAILFSERPPRVTDFLDDTLNIVYTRPPLLKTIRVTIEESFAPVPSGDHP